MDTYYPNSSNQESHVLRAPYVPIQKLDSYNELSRLPDNMFYLNQTSADDSYPELKSGSSLSPKSCDGVPYVGGTDRGVFVPFMSDCVSPLLPQQVNMAERVQNNRLSKQHILSRTSRECEDLHEQRLSLSLGAELTSSRQLPSIQYQFGNSDPLQLINFLTKDSGKVGSQNEESNTGEFLSFGLNGNAEDVTNFRDFNNSDSSRQMQYAYSFEGSQYSFENSNYLKGAQQLLDEVVNVYDALKKPKFKCIGQVDKCEGSNSYIKSDPGLRLDSGKFSGLEESAMNSSVALPNAERLDQESKLTKLLSLLKEVDTRYKQYYHQMRIVETSFEKIAGCGAAKRYTSLALQTISCQFRCLRDAINRQIQVCRQSLGEQDDEPNSSLLPRLSYVDKHIRQQRTLQQLGVMRHSWRPQKGLPESSVSVLRAWLFEHFLNPYPKDSEKSMLARKAGLTRSQVANWFINARVRLWKPMVEDMYKEEFGDLESDKKEEVKESVMSGATYDDHLRQFSGPGADPRYDLNMKESTRPDYKNLSQGDGAIDGEVISLHGDNWSGVDEHYICPQKFITSNQTDGSLNAIASPYDLSSFGDFTINSQVSNFVLQC
ncbi:hypothetical protein DCAR_0311248 [Daucus carota subsp. sativus]|uniref:Uncharacterized protein n=4 Tax=Daucus carota subsp. sativus TaxID=79200 RepID=A0A166AGC8_DAUCS|nr:PREDICTED: BEL1-like homeodomain protein 3 [Daucus carota subsp. sativus]WOG91992.1 hypothetical protein DCAR_0311248 [Daucus carota subsp. sativus]